MREIAASLPTETSEKNVLPRLWGARLTSSPVEVLCGDNDVLSLRSRTSHTLIYPNRLDDEGEEIIPRAWRP